MTILLSEPKYLWVAATPKITAVVDEDEFLGPGLAEDDPGPGLTEACLRIARAAGAVFGRRTHHEITATRFSVPNVAWEEQP